MHTTTTLRQLIELIAISCNIHNLMLLLTHLELQLQDSASAEQRKAEIHASILERNRKRAEEAKIRRETNSNRLPYEVIEAVNRDLADSFSELETLLSSSNSSSTEMIDAMMKILTDTKNLLSTSSSILPSYDIDRTQAKIDEYEDRVQEKRKLGTKKKFTFKSAQKPSKPLSSTHTALHSTEKPTATHIESIHTGNGSEDDVIDSRRATQNKTGETIILDAKSLNGDEVANEITDYSLSRLTGCEVRLLGLTSALRLSHLTDCQIYCAPTMGSIFIQNCKNIILYSASRQIRIHETTDSSFFIYTQSRPTIENCNGLKFGPYLLKHADMDLWLKQCEFNLEKNEWRNVQDFLWLRATQSPHWTPIAECEWSMKDL